MLIGIETIDVTDQVLDPCLRTHAPYHLKVVVWLPKVQEVYGIYYLIVFNEETYVVLKEKGVIWLFEACQGIFVELPYQVLHLMVDLLVMAETVEFLAVFGVHFEL